VLGATAAAALPAQIFTSLYSFSGPSSPHAPLILGGDGSLYGTTVDGDGIEFDNGIVFQIYQATDGNLYGTTFNGALDNGLAGTIFKITPAGTLTTFYSFCSQPGCKDGDKPAGRLVQGSDGNLYGTTQQGGAVSGNAGTIFSITLSGALSTLYTFCQEIFCPDGAYPTAGLIQATNGTFYGATFGGGSIGWGTIFSFSVNLGALVETRPFSGEVGAVVEILGNNLTGATSVTFNGTTAAFFVYSGTEILTIVPAGATSGTVQVVTHGGTLTSLAPFQVQP
jgi:uncharacterized repeat protein (TIGR03803 family)